MSAKRDKRRTQYDTAYIHQIHVDYRQLEDELKTLKEHKIFKLSNFRLSKVAGEKMLDKNPQIADLSDSRRPQKLECWNYCKETCEQQTKILEQNLLLASENKDGLYALSPGSSKLLTEIRKRSAKEMMPNLYEKFKSVKQDIKEDLHTYVESCLEVCWYSAINEPPLHYGFDAEEQADDFREYTQGGKIVDFVVWPAMYLFINGPILYKGVAQYKN
ncbi:unnamed protein product [Mytilus edulis]|uniref:Mitochondria-eating protein C-terminal domain-containing protein n=1 Tax=Mytilus edulis TaxID=6550 RepID=A0A8S3SP62_MYTED|nr:unnamed protein product [Mytilus edulis]